MRAPGIADVGTVLKVNGSRDTFVTRLAGGLYEKFNTVAGTGGVEPLDALLGTVKRARGVLLAMHHVNTLSSPAMLPIGMRACLPVVVRDGVVKSDEKRDRAAATLAAAASLSSLDIAAGLTAPGTSPQPIKLLRKFT